MDINAILDRLSFRGLAIAIGLIVAVSTVMSCGYKVSEQERMIVTRFGKFQSIASSGLNFKLPFIEQIESLPIEELQAMLGDQPGHPINTYTRDNQEVDATISIRYRLDTAPEVLERTYKTIGQSRAEIEKKLLSLAQDRFKVEMGKINVQDFAQTRGVIRDRIREVITADAHALGIIVTDFQIPNADYKDDFRKAISLAANAKAGVETREQELRQIEITARQRQAEAAGVANAAREAAKGQADNQVTNAEAAAKATQYQAEAAAKAALLTAEANAKATLLQAEADAKGIRLRGESAAAATLAQVKALETANERVVELKKAERWNGVLPAQMLGSVTPMMSIAAPTATAK